MPTPFGIYVHVPWCASRCPYCSFTVYVDRSPPYAQWRDGIIADWGRVREHFDGPADSLFFGGGTPSLAEPAHIRQIREALPLRPGAEVTLEANPGTISTERLRAFQDAGVNRISVGVQTFNPRFARLLNRGHTVHQAQDLLQQVKAARFRSWSLDLMFALPGQTTADIEIELDAILRLQPPHVSLYGLTIKPGTPFERAVAQGKLVLPDDTVWREQYDRIVAGLSEAGWHRYEVSNFCRHDHNAVHNESVWRGEHYAGLGPGAHGFLPDGSRTRNHSTLKAWLEDGIDEREHPSPEQAALDYLLTATRHVHGVSISALNHRGFTIPSSTRSRMVRAGWIKDSGTRLSLIGGGWALADGVTLQLADSMCPIPSET